jgi:hypothetical protein
MASQGKCKDKKGENCRRGLIECLYERTSIMSLKTGLNSIQSLTVLDIGINDPKGVERYNNAEI